MTARRKTTPKKQPTQAGQGSSARRDAVQRIPHGYGAMRDVELELDPRIDLTKPIYEQVLNLEKADKTAAE